MLRVLLCCAMYSLCAIEDSRASTLSAQEAAQVFMSGAVAQRKRGQVLRFCEGDSADESLRMHLLCHLRIVCASLLRDASLLIHPKHKHTRCCVVRSVVRSAWSHSPLTAGCTAPQSGRPPSAAQSRVRDPDIPGSSAKTRIKPAYCIWCESR